VDVVETVVGLLVVGGKGVLLVVILLAVVVLDVVVVDCEVVGLTETSILLKKGCAVVLDLAENLVKDLLVVKTRGLAVVAVKD